MVGCNLSAFIYTHIRRDFRGLWHLFQRYGRVDERTQDGPAQPATPSRRSTLNPRAGYTLTRIEASEHSDLTELLVQ